MDKETLSNHISTLGKRDFAIACRIVLEKVFGFNVVNVDGPRDGGSDFTSFADDGKRRCVGIQITTQKSDIKNLRVVINVLTNLKRFHRPVSSSLSI